MFSVSNYVYSMFYSVSRVSYNWNKVLNVGDYMLIEQGIINIHILIALELT